MTYEYESNGACPFCGLRGCGHDRTKYQGPFGIAPKVSPAVAPLTSLPGVDVITIPEVARPSTMTGALESGKAAPSQEAISAPASANRGEPVIYKGEPQAHRQAAVTAGETAPISAYDEPVAPPPTVVPITPKVGVERVLQVIEKRSKRKKTKSEQGSLF